MRNTKRQTASGEASRAGPDSLCLTTTCASDIFSLSTDRRLPDSPCLRKQDNRAGARRNVAGIPRSAVVRALRTGGGMKASTTLISGVFLASVLSAATASAKPKHWHDDEKHWNRRDGDRDDRHEAKCYFRHDDVRIIREYYEPRYRALPPGLAKKYARTGHLPRGWEKKMEPLPAEVERRLVVLPPQYRRGYFDGSIVVYSPRTHVVVDVVAVFRP